MCTGHARRRADGAVRLSESAGERRRTRCARGARHPAGARRTQRRERQQRRAAAGGAHRPRIRPGRGGRDRRSVRRGAQCRGAGASPSPNPGRSSSPQPCSARSQGCSSRKIVARMNSKALPAPVTLYRIVRASGGGRRGGGRALTPLVGREEELERLESALGACARRRGPTRPRDRASPASGSRGWSRSSTLSLARRLTHGWNGRRRSSCKIPRCTRSWNGAACGSAAPTRPTDRDSLISRTLSGSVGLDAAEYAPMLALLVEVPLTEDRRLDSRRTNCDADSWRR